MSEHLIEYGCYGYINDDNPLCIDCEVGVACMVEQNNVKHYPGINVDIRAPEMDDTAYQEFVKTVSAKMAEAFKKFNRGFYGF